MTHYDKTPIAAVIVTCGAKASTPVKVGPPIRWRCGRNAGHEGPHQALGFEGRVVKEWPR